MTNKVKDLNQPVRIKKYQKTYISKIELLERDPVYFACWKSTYKSGKKLAIDTVRGLFKSLTGKTVAVGTTHLWLQTYHPEMVRKNEVPYGMGDQVRFGKSQKNEFTSNGQRYVRTKFGWEKDYRVINAVKLAQNNGKDMVVHHKDGNHSNNHPDNLAIMTRGEHTSMHIKAYWKKYREKKAKMEAINKALVRIDNLLACVNK